MTDQERIDKAVELAIWYCKDANLGYDQLNRFDFPEYPDTETAGESDCSSLVYKCFELAGFGVTLVKGKYTGTEIADFTGIGFTKIPWSSIATQENLVKGDILLRLNGGGHTAIWTGDAIAESYIDENGNDRRGQNGDQLNDTDHGETRLSPFRSNWDWVLRFIPQDEEPEEKEEAVEFGYNGNAFTKKQLAFAFVYQKYADGTMNVQARDWFNATTKASRTAIFFTPHGSDTNYQAFADVPSVELSCDNDNIELTVTNTTVDGVRFTIATKDGSYVPRTVVNAVFSGKWE